MLTKLSMLCNNGIECKCHHFVSTQHKNPAQKKAQPNRSEKITETEEEEVEEAGKKSMK